MKTQLRLRMPAEWEPQKAIWLAWPHNSRDWPDRFAPIPWVYAEIIRYLVKAERVRLIIKNKYQQEQATQILQRHGVNLDQIDFVIAPTNRVWLRDSGPTFVYDCDSKKRYLLDWRFNAWAKYSNYQHDNQIPAQVEKFLGLPRIQPMHKKRRVVLEGGSIEVNGQGALITTEECLLSQTQCRNPGFTRQDYEDLFATYLGITHTVWLKNGIAGDDTHGHIDDLARFVNASTVVAMIEPNPKDKNYLPLLDNSKHLKKNFDVVELPMPKPIFYEKTRLPASYVNFLIANHLVLVPVFNDVNDRIALDIFTELFPKHTVIPIYCGDFIWGLGTIHCASQQEPA